MSTPVLIWYFKEGGMPIRQDHIYGTCGTGDASRPVAGTAGNLLPRLFVHFVDIILDRKILAAHRAAHRHCASP